MLGGCVNVTNPEGSLQQDSMQDDHMTRTVLLLSMCLRFRSYNSNV